MSCCNSRAATSGYAFSKHCHQYWAHLHSTHAMLLVCWLHHQIFDLHNLNSIWWFAETKALPSLLPTIETPTLASKLTYLYSFSPKKSSEFESTFSISHTRKCAVVLWPSLRQSVGFASSEMVACLEIGPFAVKFRFHKPREIWWSKCQQMIALLA